MKALVIYDETGRIWNVIYGETEAPKGLLHMFVTIPDNAKLTMIDVSEDEHKPVFEYLPESEVGRLEEKINDTSSKMAEMQEALDFLLMQ